MFTKGYQDKWGRRVHGFVTGAAARRGQEKLLVNDGRGGGGCPQLQPCVQPQTGEGTAGAEQPRAAGAAVKGGTFCRALQGPRQEGPGVGWRRASAQRASR